jgi:nicotinamidase-related amidase
MQNDFIDGSLGTVEATKIVPRAKEIINQYFEADDTLLLFTRDTHDSTTYPNTQEGKKLPVPHCIHNTKGWDINSEIISDINMDSEKVFIVDKPTFGQMSLWKTIVREMDVDVINDLEEIRIIGLCTDICVVSNALILKATFPEVPMVCDSSACAGVTVEKHEAALEVMRSCQIEVI